MLCEIGNGTLDFKSIVAAAKEAGCKWFIFEQDSTPDDQADSRAQSFRCLPENICS